MCCPALLPWAPDWNVGTAPSSPRRQRVLPSLHRLWQPSGTRKVSDPISCTTPAAPSCSLQWKGHSTLSMLHFVFWSQTTKSKEPGRALNTGFACELKLEAADSSLKPTQRWKPYTVLEVLIKFLPCTVDSMTKHEKTRQQNFITLTKFPRDLCCTSPKRWYSYI